MTRALAALALVVACSSSKGQARPAPTTIKVAVVGGIVEMGLWQEVAARYQRLTGHTVELAASGPKPMVVRAFQKGGIDLITVHASDAMINLVADGIAKDPQPWLRNDLVIVGPVEDPAGIKGGKDAIAALRKIVETKSPFVTHASNGADGVLHDLREEGKFAIDAASTIVFNGENQHEILNTAAKAKAYTIVGRIPVISGKLKGEGIAIMVQGDPKLRRPYLVEVATKGNPVAADLAAFLRSPETQAFVASYGKGKYDDQPLFFPITLP